VAAITLTNGKTWASQKAAKAHFKDILHAYSNGAIVDDAGHHDDLVALVARFDAVLPVEERKGSAGIARFDRRLNTGAGFATPGFWLVRPNGEATDFSYLKAIEGRIKSQDQEFADACRRAVASDLNAFMRAQFARAPNGVVACGLTDAPVTQAEAHVDHDDPSFGSIILSFRQAQGWGVVVPPGVLTSGADAQTTTTFVGAADEAAFRAFHQTHARLRVVSASANLARAAGQRRPGPIA
jgi:hypothetical protein